MGRLFIWSCCEPYIGIVCACLPTLGPFFRRWWVILVTKTGGSSSNLSSGDVNFSEHMRGTRRSVLVENIGEHGLAGEELNGRKSGSSRDWILLQGAVKVRNDDQMELTTEVTGPGGPRSTNIDEELEGNSPQDIRVQKDVTWTSARVRVHRG